MCVGEHVFDFGSNFGAVWLGGIERYISRSPLRFSMILRISSGNKDC